MILFFLSWIARYHQYPPDKNGLDQKKPYLVLAPTMLAEQWAEECSSLSHDLSLVHVYRGGRYESKGMSPTSPSDDSSEDPNADGFSYVKVR